MVIVGFMRFFMLIILVIMAFILVFISIIIPLKFWRYVVKYWCRLFFVFLGIKVVFKGNTTIHHYTPNSLLVANHISWLDIPLINSRFSVSFISMQELRNWFIVGYLAKKLNTIFISRANKKDLLNINQQVNSVLQKDGSVMFFPEGATSLGDGVKPFKSSLFESAIIAKSKIIPLSIVYSIKGLRTEVVTYAGGINFWQAFKNVLLIRNLVATINILPELIIQNDDTRSQLADKAFIQVKNSYCNFCNITEE